MNPDPDPARSDPSRPDELPLAGTVVEARIVRYDDQPDELTLYPRDISRGRQATTWISAREGSFVDLQEHR